MREISDRFTRGEMGLGEARNQLKDFLRENNVGDKSRSIRNLASTARLNLVLKQNRAMARAVGKYKEMTNPAIMKRYPYVVYHANHDGATRDSHGALDGKIFRKDDPFLRTHFPPWEFNCRCWLEDCDEETAGKAGGAVPPTPPDQVRVESESGFAFDPSRPFEEFDLSTVRTPEVRQNIADLMAQKFQTKVTFDGKLKLPTETAKLEKQEEKTQVLHEEHVARRKEQLRQAYEKRLSAWESQMRASGLKEDVISEVKKFYTLDAAINGKPPKIEAAPDVKGAYISKDGKTLFIGHASMKDVKKALKDLPHTIKRGMQYRAAKAKRAEREANMIGAKLIRGIHTTDGDARKTNPHIGENGKAFSHNCQRCITAYEARRRGIDVESMPRLLNPDGSTKNESIAKNKGWSMVYKNADPKEIKGATGKGVRKSILSHLRAMPDGARCAVQVTYENGGGHVFIAERHHGKTVFLDPQDPSRTEEDLLGGIAGDGAALMRLDNLKFNDNVTICCKPREKWP